jgi:hypothetical protein
VQSAVAPGATIHTDGWSGYAGLETAGYRHKVSIISAWRVHRRLKMLVQATRSCRSARRR